MTTRKIMEELGVPRKTVIRHARALDGLYVGGRTGWVFPAKAPDYLRTILRVGKASKQKSPTTHPQ